MDTSIKNNQKFLDAERFLIYEKSVINSNRFNEIINLIDRDGIKVLDIGGASGLFLDELSKKSGKKINLYNFEIDEYYESRQTNPNINFIQGTIVNSKLEENFFDIVTFGDVLHHLIGKNLNETIRNQHTAIREIFRIAKNGGHIVFNEEVNNIKFFSRIIYFLSRFATRFKIKFPFFDAGKVIVLFPTQEEVAKIIEKENNTYSVKIIKKYFNKWDMLLRWKLTLLMNNVGHINYVIKKLDN